MKIYYSPYSLAKKGKVNAKDTSGFREGALIKIVQDDYWGVADISPWPELGDLSWRKELEVMGPLFKRALILAKQDLKARAAKKSLLRDKFVINNYLVTDYKSFNYSDPKYAGKTVKLKGDQSFGELAKLIHQIPSNIRIRIDFNNCLSSAEFDIFLKAIKGATHKIEYIEDPAPYNAKYWRRWNKIVPLAWDFQKSKPGLLRYLFRIIKPSRESTPKFSFKKLTFTSSLEHPVGFAHALRIAQAKAKDASGFLTLDLFETTAFHKYFVQNENKVNFSSLALSDYGIGMTEELNRLEWKEL